MSWATRLKKLRKISADELRCRATEVARIRWEQVCHGLGRRPTFRPLATPRDLLARAARMTPGAAQLEGLKREFPAEHEAITARVLPRVERLLSGHVTLLHREVALPERVAWRTDPLTGYDFPRAFYARVPQDSLAGRVDVKYVWELNRHQFLVDLALGYRLTGERRCAERVRALILDWIAENPLHESINWTSALELAMRAISWQGALAALADWPEWRDDELQTIARSLGEHAEFLQGHFSWYSSPYNHLIGEAAGLYVLALWLAEVPRADAWRASSSQVFARRGAAQFYADGFTVEQASGYHFYTTAFLAIVAAAHRNLCPASRCESVERLLPGAFAAGAALMPPDGRWPTFGDIDSARALPLLPDDFLDFRSLLALGAVLCDEPAWRSRSPRAGEETFWLLGLEGVRRWYALSATPWPRQHVLPSAGYAVARSDDTPSADWLCFEAGPIAAGLFVDDTPSVAHGHLDTLQVLASFRGRPVLVDAGMPHYFGERAPVDHCRGAGGHNTLEIEGAPLAQTASRLGWHSVREQVELAANLSDDAWIACGRMRLAEGIVATRYVFGLPGQGLWLADHVEVDRPRRVTWYWRLAEPVDAEQAAAMAARRAIELPWGELSIRCMSGQLACSVDLPHEGRPEGWIYPEYGARQPGSRVVASTVVEREALVLTSLRHGAARVAVQLQHAALADDGAPEQATIAGSAEVLWSVALDSQVSHFAAGGSAPEPESGDAYQATPLPGVGDWRAWRVAPVSARQHVVHA